MEKETGRGAGIDLGAAGRPDSAENVDHLVQQRDLPASVRKTPSWPRSWANFSLL